MRICITGGGTGGHLMIAKSLAEEAKKRGHRVVFIGSTYGQDRNYFENSSLFDEVYFFETTGVVNQKGFKKFVALYKIFKAFLGARAILKKEGIDATYSVGGFSSAPASFASLFLKIPFFIHEQNAVKGRLNAILQPYTTNYICAYDKETPIEGYPVGEFFFESARVREKLECIIFLGGSHGAKAINDLALSVAKELQSRGIKILHQAGVSDFERVESEYKKLGVEVELYGFTKELGELISRADLAISRAGASTLWELSANGCPALFVPYPYAAGDHQYYNAEFIVENELGWCEREGKNLESKLLEVLDEPLEKRSKKLLDFAKKDVALKMIQDVEERVKC
jgi:UDP-N-acetylglucosamine--N-acetylmuramyl-(pentapeptide) pyrophosphoryl-undecaprenol N-acetylglucosamine transferase